MARNPVAPSEKSASRAGVGSGNSEPFFPSRYSLARGPPTSDDVSVLGSWMRMPRPLSGKSLQPTGRSLSLYTVGRSDG
jgi:hypothetical protein